MKKIYVSPEVEVVLLRLSECILSSTESTVNEQVTEFSDPLNPGDL